MLTYTAFRTREKQLRNGWSNANEENKLKVGTVFTARFFSLKTLKPHAAYPETPGICKSEAYSAERLEFRGALPLPPPPHTRQGCTSQWGLEAGSSPARSTRSHATTRAVLSLTSTPAHSEVTQVP